MPTQKGEVLARKERALEAFLQSLQLHPQYGDVLRIVHHGSTLRGDAHPESDVDVLILAAGNLRTLQDTCSDLAFSVLLATGERIEPLVYCADELERPNWFISSALEAGREVYAMEPEEARRRQALDLLGLAEEYVAMARRLPPSGNERGTIDFAYNAAELAAKGFLVLDAEALPRTHGGIVGTFSRTWIHDRHEIPEEVGRLLNRTLDRRNRARYDPHAALTAGEAGEAVAVAEQLIATLRLRITPRA